MTMRSFTTISLAGAACCLPATIAQAQGDMARCTTIAAPAARLACYDEMAGRASPAPTTPMPSPPTSKPVFTTTPTTPAPAVAQAPSTQQTTDYAALRKRSNFNAVALEVEPLPHGLFRLHLADGTAYDTSMEGAHIAKGMTLHIRRSPLGTTFVDLPGQAPIPVRLYRPG